MYFNLIMTVFINRFFAPLNVLVLLFLAQSVQAVDAPSNDISNIKLFWNTELELGARFRYERVEQFDDSGHANTVKLRAHTTTSINDNWRVEFELDHVEAYAEDHHSDGVFDNGKLTIVDPEGTEINEAFINAQYGDISARLGRQRIEFSDERFIGSVDFRQNDQTFDALLLTLNFLTASQLDYAYVNKVHTIFGDDASARLLPEDARFNALAGQRPLSLRGEYRLEGHLLNLSLKEWDHLELNSYVYAVDNETFAAFSNHSVGFRADYRRKVAGIRLLANTELAMQKQQDSTVDDWLAYYMFEAGAGYRNVQLSLRGEQFGEKDGLAFITPLATLHRFQGWADQFLMTPPTGLRDSTLRVLWKRRPMSVDVRYHRYDSVKDSVHIGDELNVDWIYRFNRKQAVKLRYADFDAQLNQQIVPGSVKKLFLMYSYNL